MDSGSDAAGFFLRSYEAIIIIVIYFISCCFPRPELKAVYYCILIISVFLIISENKNLRIFMQHESEKVSVLGG